MIASEVPVLRNRASAVARPSARKTSPLAPAMWADPIVTRYIGGKPLSAEEAWAKVLRYGGLWALVGFGYWALEDKSTGLYVGELGFGDFKRQIEPPLNHAPELGWALVSNAHSKGYATEGVRAAVAWGDKHFRSPHRVHHSSGQPRVDSRGGEVRLSRVPAHHLQGARGDHVRAPAATRLGRDMRDAKPHPSKSGLDGAPGSRWPFTNAESLHRSVI